MERANGCIEGSQLTLQPITPEDEHGHLALLMLPSPLLEIGTSIAAERRKHGRKTIVPILADPPWSRESLLAWLARIHDLP
jgi:hypothetical protein